MKRFPLNLALVVLILAVLGALLHPLALVLSWLPFDPRGLVSVLGDVRATIADVLGWGVLALLLVMVAYVVRGQILDKTPHSALANWWADPARSESAFGIPPTAVVAITAYNDDEATAQAVRDFRRQPGVIKVLVIDNNSTDRTAELAVAAGATVITETRQGYGYACMRGLLEGMRVPEADVVVLTEGDGTFVAEDTAKFLAYMSHADLVVGNRMVRGLVEPDSQMDHFFMWGNMAVAMLLRLRFWDGRFLGPAGLTDVGCTFRAVRRRALESILPELRVGGNHFSPHMLLVALAHGFSVIEIPIRFRRRVGDSKGASQSLRKGAYVGLAMIWHIITFNPNGSAQRPAVVVERDGVIIRHRQDDDSGRTQVEFVPGAAQGLATLSQRGLSVLVIADRSDHERAGISRRLEKAIDARIAAEVQHRGGHIDAFLVCPHSQDRLCACRHPRPQLLLKAAQRSPLDLTQAIVISDHPTFLKAAGDIGCRTILVGSGSSVPEADSPRSHRAQDLAAAVELVLGVHSDSASVMEVDLQSVS
jgi:histidinol-phosphate phosphatase family protein